MRSQASGSLSAGPLTGVGERLRDARAIVVGHVAPHDRVEDDSGAAAALACELLLEPVGSARRRRP
jgi:hypothetical protein